MPVETEVSVQQCRCYPTRISEVVHRRLRRFEEHDGRDDGKDDRDDPIARSSCRRDILTNFRGLFSAVYVSRHHRLTYSDAAECYFKKCALPNRGLIRLKRFQKLRTL